MTDRRAIAALAVATVALQWACQTEPIEIATDGDAEANDRDDATDGEQGIVLGDACMRWEPSAIAFGTRALGHTVERVMEISSCNDVPLVIRSVELSVSANGQFALAPAATDWPVTLLPNQRLPITLRYTPNAITPVAEGDWGELILVAANAPQHRFRIPIQGWGIAPTCPTPSFVVAEGAIVRPGTLLHFDGSASLAPNGFVRDYDWSVTQPDGATTPLPASDGGPTATFRPVAKGEYVFRLGLTDDIGMRSCAAAEHRVSVGLGFEVEVVWHTPGDPDETDTSEPMAVESAGSDIDLHVQREHANGGYYGPFDCYVGNPQPDWGTPGPPNDPAFLREDSDGVGPERVVVVAPEAGLRYQVGTAYVDDWGYGDSIATVRVFIRGELRDEWSMLLGMGQHWDSHIIEWPSGNVTRIGTNDAPHIVATPYPYY